MRKLLTTLFVIFISIVSGLSQNKLLTVAEKSDFQSTSGYKDVMQFIENLKKTSQYIRVETIATSNEGRKIPLMIIGKPLPVSPESLKNDDRIVIYIQGNIHAGEVEGKEALLMFARDILNEKDPEILKRAVILICPIFNTDGNERISTDNRPTQNGPANGVGVRYNAQFLDLNRDALKAESPEVRGLLKNVFNRWDPYVFMDCHTTNGSFHVEPVTFTWMVNPNGDSNLISYMREKMMPEMSHTLLQKYKTENCFYGEFYDMLDPEKGWVMEAAEPRYMTNYVGIRNRLSILNENYVYADFKSRVWGCYYLINSLCDYVKSNIDEIKKIIAESDRKSVARIGNSQVSDSFALEYAVRSIKNNVTIKTYEAEETNEVSDWKTYRNTGRQKTVTVPYYIDYYAIKSVVLPAAYVLDVSDISVIDLLKNHGIRLEKLVRDTELAVERFDISELKGSPRLNQGHYINSVKGNFINETKKFPEGTIIVRMNQPLANVCAYLLEPQSGEGLLAWNYLDRYLVPQWGNGFLPYPVYRLLKGSELITSPLK
jgi:hypothetical protein